VTGTDSTSGSRWSSPWIDAAAFAVGLALAWFGAWETRDLVWSLWLSSLLVGYAMIVWQLFGPGVRLAAGAWRHRGALEGAPSGSAIGVGALVFVGALFLLAFFTVHFGGFHFVHSVFLNAFFPLEPGRSGVPDLAFYGRVLAAYWPFVIPAALAERQAFFEPATGTIAADTAVTPEAIAARKRRRSAEGGMTGMMAPYRNVIRLHLLIFFFAFASFVHLEHFAVYAVVYAVYFFPWRLLRPRRATSV
jgi:hypothetical protein